MLKKKKSPESDLPFLYAKQFISFDFGVKYNRKCIHEIHPRRTNTKKDYFIRLLRENNCFRRLPLVFNIAFASLIVNEGTKVLPVKDLFVFCMLSML